MDLQVLLHEYLTDGEVEEPENPLTKDILRNTFKPLIENISLQTNNQPSIEQVINKMRDDVLRSQSTASTTSILSFDNLVEQMKVFAHQINDKTNEIVRLQDLCRKNNIDTAIQPKETKVIPPKATK